MKLLFLTDNFYPEVNAPATRTIEHCREWVRNGIDVTVVTCNPNFPQGKIYAGYRNRPYRVEYIDGIRVVRVWSYITANEGFLKRTLDYISFSITGFLAGLFQRADLIVATSPQFFTALAGRTLSFWKRTPWIMEVRDLWPESIKTVGAMKDNAAIRYFEWQEKRCYRSARHIVVVTDSFREKLIGRGVPADKISIVKNGANLTLYHPLPKDRQLQESLRLGDKKVVGYIGTFGMAHKLDFILQCAKETSDGSIHYLLIGEGAEKGKLLKMKEELHLTNVTILGAVPKEQVPRYISLLDVALINLRKSDLFKSVIPSKMFENAAMNVPILMGVDGEARQIVESYHAGLCFEPECKDDFFDKLHRLTGDPQCYTKCVEGCRTLAAAYDRKRLAADMLTVIRNCR